jgi:hypothetical protein
MNTPNDFKAFIKITSVQDAYMLEGDTQPVDSYI